MTFQPIFKERIWGGRMLETLYGKVLPPGAPIGESWEIADRPGDTSVIANGPLAGKTLSWLMEEHAAEVLGPGAAPGRFPLLIKVLDARDKLSLQVHPTEEVARRLGGEPKTEMWYIAHADPGAELYAGLKRGVTHEEFERRLADGTVAECLHRMPVQAGDVMFLPSGRVHAIGAGLVIFEIQQNSDTTYRVFDWNRVGLDGKPRDLHIPESLASINFDDAEPGLSQSQFSRNPRMKLRIVVDKPLFRVDAYQVKRGEWYHVVLPVAQIIGLLKGRLHLRMKDFELVLRAGEFALLSAAIERVTITAQTAVEYIQVQPGYTTTSSVPPRS